MLNESLSTVEEKLVVLIRKINDQIRKAQDFTFIQYLENIQVKEIPTLGELQKFFETFNQRLRDLAEPIIEYLKSSHYLFMQESAFPSSLHNKLSIETIYGPETELLLFQTQLSLFRRFEKKLKKLQEIRSEALEDHEMTIECQIETVETASPPSPVATDLEKEEVKPTPATITAAQTLSKESLQAEIKEVFSGKTRSILKGLNGLFEQYHISNGLIWGKGDHRLLVIKIKNGSVRIPIPDHYELKKGTKKGIERKIIEAIT